MLRSQRGYYLLTRGRMLKNIIASPLSQAAAKSDCFLFACFLLLIVNGSMLLFQCDLVACHIFLDLVLYVLLDYLRVFPAVSTKHPRHQKFLLPYLYFIFACPPKILSALLLLSVPSNCTILMYGRMLTERWCYPYRPLPQ